MNIKRAIGASILTYITTFIAGIIFAKTLGVTDPSVDQVPVLLWILGIAAAICFTWIFSKWYFKSSRVTSGSRQGLILGVIMILVGFVLDVLTVLPSTGSLGEGLALLGDYYGQWFFWVTVILIISTTTYVGKKIRRI